MFLIVGLGNPGEEYNKTRHNVGFDVVDKLAQKYNIKISKRKFEGLYGKGEIEGEKVVLLKPQTYMNLSGNSVGQFVSFFKLKEEEIIIIYDDFDIPTGIIKVRKKGGPGTHNGMRSVLGELCSINIPRIRIGTGSEDKGYNLMDYVTSKLDEKEYEKVVKGIDQAEKAVEEIMKNGIDTAMNRFN